MVELFLRPCRTVTNTWLYKMFDDDGSERKQMFYKITENELVSIPFTLHLTVPADLKTTWDMSPFHKWMG